MTERFIVEFEHNAVFSNQNFSVKRDRHTPTKKNARYSQHKRL
ncbi:hypothetical protein [Endozoicomonas sp. SESOKO4]|nr:hypothetical protein [Endozoicomonas sp. SESOKO4]